MLCNRRNAPRYFSKLTVIAGPAPLLAKWLQSGKLEKHVLPLNVAAQSTENVNELNFLYSQIERCLR